MQTDETALRERGSSAVSDRTPPAQTRVTWPDVLRALGRDVVRSYALDRLAGSGFSADLFANSRKGRPCREAVADALTRTEDWLEYEHAKWPERWTIQAVRRRLELELWP